MNNQLFLDYSLTEQQQTLLNTYVEWVLKANQKLNLIARSTEAEIWERHVLDSLQLLHYLAAEKGVWLDLGSGAGFPGLVIAITSNYQVHLVEKSPRKCQFLAQFVSTAQLKNVTIHQQKLAAMKPLAADVISARAFAPLPKLLACLRPLLTSKNYCLAHRGRNFAAELEELDKKGFVFEVLPSLTSSESRIFKITKAK